MAFTFEQLIEPPTQTEALAEVVTVLSASGIDVTDWTPTSPQMQMLQQVGWMYYLNASRAAAIANFSNLKTSSGYALEVLSENIFSESKQFGVPTVGTFGLTLEAGSQPVNAAIGDIRVTDGTSIFSNAAPVLLNGSTLVATASFASSEPGALSNISNGTPLTLISTIDGLSVQTAPADGSSTSWITNLGTDDESDERLKTRCQTKWSTLSPGEQVIDRVTHTVLNAVPSIKRVAVNDQNPNGPGTFKVFCGGAVQPSPSGDVALAAAALTGSNIFFNAAERIEVTAVSASYWDRTISIYYNPSFTVSSLSASIETTLNGVLASSSLGGDSFGSTQNVFSCDKVVDNLKNIQGVEKVNLSDYSDISLVDASGNLGMTSRPLSGWGSYLEFFVK
jgi:hypothetical protein